MNRMPSLPQLRRSNFNSLWSSRSSTCASVLSLMPSFSPVQRRTLHSAVTPRYGAPPPRVHRVIGCPSRSVPLHLCQRSVEVKLTARSLQWGSRCFATVADTQTASSTSVPFSSAAGTSSNSSSHSPNTNASSSSSSPPPSSSSSSPSSSSSLQALFRKYIPNDNRRRASYLLLGFLAVFGTSALVVTYSLPSNPINEAAYEVYIVCYAIVRISRDIVTVVRMIADYAWTLRSFGHSHDEKENVSDSASEGDGSKPRKPSQSAARAAALEEAHWRNAVLLRNCFNKNGGVYLKFGQHLAQMQWILPDAYCDTMQSTLHQAPTSPFAEVRATVEESLQQPLETMFASFNPVPIASASLAQVHFATLHSGEEVAVKVQHRFLRATVDSDIKAVSFLVKTVHRFFPVFDYNWLADQMSESLPLECDFRLEGRNADRCREMFRDRDDVLIPKIYWNYTNERVITMQRMRGVMLTDVPAIKSLGLKAVDVSELVSDVFSQMMFLNGFTHADPHSANCFVTSHSRYPHKPALVILDHGLYSEISPSFRMLYARLWRALIMADSEQVKKYAELCGAGEMHLLFAAMLTRRPWTDNNKSSFSALSNESNPDRHQMQAIAAQFGIDIQGILARMPKPMILLLKTNEILHNISAQLGTSYTPFLIMARYCQLAINQDRLQHDASAFHAYRQNFVETLSIESRILAFEAIMLVQSWLSYVRHSIVSIFQMRDFHFFHRSPRQRIL